MGTESVEPSTLTVEDCQYDPFDEVKAAKLVSPAGAPDRLTVAVVEVEFSLTRTTVSTAAES
jgi:hypothetical protein